ncbi:isoliquiritigenin 2'-O-methyltransferase-like [Senna tora]|uniref:Isoliquiritigenin 2'-O-methyltransferase-like n=1 Tax=Senna tora TaxID=362788 RepID=A0A835CA44_9FABA|nr:isoliquiritigenin 2'-O-methyltransferase-like [Senna tora]
MSAMILCFTQIQSGAINAAIELNIFDIIANKSNINNGRHVSATEVASELPASARHQNLVPKLDRLLRLLANHSLLTCSYGAANGDGDSQGERLYGISSVGKFFVSGNETKGGYVALSSLFLSYGALLDTWLNFKNAIIDEDADIFQKIHGIPFYQFSNKDPKLNTLFNKSMGNLSFTMMKKLLEVYKGFEGISTLVDVGGGTGRNISMVISKYPSIKGIEHIGGDMFEGVPKGDAIMLKNVLHNWWDENSIKILKKCHEALPENGKVIVVEFIMPEVKASEDAKFASLLDSLMFVHDGRERTEKEYEFLCKTSGFSGFKVASRPFSVLGVMEFYK